MAILLHSILIAWVALQKCNAQSWNYEVSDDLGIGRRFDGIGGLSGGGPSFGASLQILKVEIGGDDQSTDGTEASHMHEEWDENYNRGYEWWLMKEAKKRNPDMKLWGLSWAWPGWIGGGKQSPYTNLTKTALYTIKWIQGAKTHHNLDIDYIGIWNEQQCNLDYILYLRNALNSNGLQNVSIVACDGWTGDLYSLTKNSTVAGALYAFGVHYPGTIIPNEVIATNYTIWSSEDYSTYDDDVGAGCWARILNQNYVNGYMTSTTAWNLIASYYPGLPYEYDGLMNAVEPWSGYYEIKNPIWITAHTTQFTKIGFRYLAHGHGVGLLKYGGSFVSFTSNNRKNLTIVIETFTHDHSICIRPSLPPYAVQQQKAVFKFGGSFVSNSRLALSLDVDSVYTLTTSQSGQKGDFGQIPSSQPFPLPYFDDFQKYQLNEEPYLLSPQLGVWEINRDNDGNQYARQTVLTQPVVWCETKSCPAAIIGNAKWSDATISAKIRIPSVNGTSQVFLGLRVTKSGCDTGSANGIFFWVTPDSQGYAVSSDIAGLNITDAGLFSDRPVEYDKWYNISVSIKNNVYVAKFNDIVITQLQANGIGPASAGFAALGTGGWGYADFDDLNVSK